MRPAIATIVLYQMQPLQNESISSASGRSIITSKGKPNASTMKRKPTLRRLCSNMSSEIDPGDQGSRVTRTPTGGTLPRRGWPLGARWGRIARPAPLDGNAGRSLRFQQLRQLGDVDRDPPRRRFSGNSFRYRHCVQAGSGGTAPSRTSRRHNSHLPLGGARRRKLHTHRRPGKRLLAFLRSFDARSTDK